MLIGSDGFLSLYLFVESCDVNSLTFLSPINGLITEIERKAKSKTLGSGICLHVELLIDLRKRYLNLIISFRLFTCVTCLF